MTLKIGSFVRPSVGPHKDQIHEVVHVFDDGHANIRLIEEDVECQYKSDVITSDPGFLTEEVLLEYNEPHGFWWHNMSKTGKEEYRRNHPDAQGTFGHEPFSTKHHREKSKAHQRYADWHENQMHAHREKAEIHSEKPKYNGEKIIHHDTLKNEHAVEFYNHSTKAIHHHVLANGGRAPSNLLVHSSAAHVG